ncbi:MAG: hypothetical protein ABIA76_04860 [Candidatus Diapherotrites archaeon]
MALLSTVVEKRFSYEYTTLKRKCLNCNTELISQDNIYSRRFCSEQCKLNYLL